jgi:hypothetical protein
MMPEPLESLVTCEDYWVDKILSVAKKITFLEIRVKNWIEAVYGC